MCARIDQESALAGNALVPIAPSNSVPGRELTDAERRLALSRRPLIDSLLTLERRTAADVDRVASTLGCSQRTVYNILKRYSRTRHLGDLIPRRHRGARRPRLLPAVEAEITATLNDFYLTQLNPTVKEAIDACRSRCDRAGLPMPDPKTIRVRINAFSKFEITMRRRGVKKARALYGVVDGKTPETQFPLQRCQIDHTKVDIIIVDEAHRMPLCRPWLSLALDEYSRAFLGMYLSLESPSATSVGMCIAHAMLPKDEWAARIGLRHDWPMHGPLDETYTDNGADFRSEAVERGCETWGIKLSYRPPGATHWGGLIERAIGTVMRSIRTLPGATGSNINDRGDQDPSLSSAMTLKELEFAIATFITGVYHRRIHSAHGSTPLARWHSGIAQRVEALGPLPEITEPERLVIDFLPLARRKLGRDGIRWGTIRYMDDVLRPLIANRDGQELLVRRDPRDVSKIYFLNPTDQRYYTIRARDLTFPNASLWEVEEARRRLLQQGRVGFDERDIHEAMEVIRETANRAVADTRRARGSKGARLRVERRAGASRHSLDPTPSSPKVPPYSGEKENSPAPINDDDDIELFGIEE